MSENDIQKGLEQDAQRILERVPKNANQENTRHIAEALKGVMKEQGISQAQVGRWIGYSSSTVSEFVSGRYNGNYEKLANKIVNLVNGLHRKRKAAKDKVHVQTGVAIAIQTLILQVEAFSEDEGKIGLVIGDAGHGKSCCLQEYGKANLNSLYVELDKTMNSVGIFAEIAKELGLDASGALPLICGRLIETLKHRHIIIMLDEASALTVKQLDQLRQIITVKSRCPLILAGNRDLYGTVTQPPTKRGCESLDQFVSRLVQIVNLDEMAIDKDGGLYTPDDIRKLYEYGGVRLTSDGIDTLRRICKTPNSGRLRTCNVIITALHTSRVAFEEGFIDAGLIVAVIKRLDLPVKERLPLSAMEASGNVKPNHAQAVAG